MEGIKTTFFYNLYFIKLKETYYIYTITGFNNLKSYIFLLIILKLFLNAKKYKAIFMIFFILYFF